MTATEGDVNGSDHVVARNGDDQIALRISEWQKRLLQLDRRNNPVWLDPGRHAVGIVGNAADDFDQWLHPHYGWVVTGPFGEFASRASPLSERPRSCPLFFDYLPRLDLSLRELLGTPQGEP